MRDDVFEKVRACVSDSLAIEPREIEPTSKLFTDLGANSLDFIDILFMIENEFGIQVQETDFNFLARLDFSSQEVMRDGHLTRETIEQLAPWLPALRELPDPGQVTPETLFSLVTIETVCTVVERAQEET